MSGFLGRAFCPKDEKRYGNTFTPETNTGMLIQKIEQMFETVVTYKTNLVKCLPLTKEQKLRYPSKGESDGCFEHLVSEIYIISPKIVFLLGEKVHLSVEKHLNIIIKNIRGHIMVPIHHPSYIYIYKRKQIDKYIESVKKIINELLSVPFVGKL